MTNPKNKHHVVPIQRGQYNATVTPLWFVDESEYTPKLASFKPLVNGVEAFGEVYRAIEAAKKSVSIICWGFQPSMYFVRDGQALMIGKLLEKKAREGVMVRVLCWAFQMTESDRVNVTGMEMGLGESNTPGRWMAAIGDRPEISTDAQYAYDEQFYRIYDRKQSAMGEFGRKYVISDDFPKDKLLFTSRSYNSADSKQVNQLNYIDEGISNETRRMLRWFPSHHQKMVVVDHEDPQAAVGFVMGHNMLDGYWDTSAHSHARQEANRGRNGLNPLHDYSSRVTGPIVGDLFRNFSSAWERETKESLALPAFEAYPIRGGDAQAVCQMLRTQPQHGRQDIAKCYLQAANNAAQYIHIENQYFRWPPLAEKIKAAAAKMAQWGRTPEEHGSLYLFVITNSSDTGIGAGTVNTHRMLDSLGRADRLPEVARYQRLEALNNELDPIKARMRQLFDENYAIERQGHLLQSMPDIQARQMQRYEANKREFSALEAKKRELDDAKAKLDPKGQNEAIKPENRPGLKVHVCTLVAPDTPAGQEWQEVYIHAKLMLIDDAFMTLGSANINTRSMQSDSELNIAHHRPEITQPLRMQQWATYTGGRVSGGMALQKAYEAWGALMDTNTNAKKLSRRPVAQLAEFLRTSNKISNND
jgi:phosphatidylserine/phosphatidylglycerophosphate/cardiolipin synthase-like enzyme